MLKRKKFPHFSTKETVEGALALEPGDRRPGLAAMTVLTSVCSRAKWGYLNLFDGLSWGFYEVIIVKQLIKYDTVILVTDLKKWNYRVEGQAHCECSWNTLPSSERLY